MRSATRRRRRRRGRCSTTSRAPAGITTLGGTSPTVHPSLTWTAATDTGGSNLAGYRVYRDGAQITQTTAVSFTDASLAIDGTYAYVVRAIDGAGNLGPPSPARTIQVDQTPPPAPTMNVPVSPTRTVTFSWNAPDDGASGSGIAGYRIYRNGAPLSASPVLPAFTDGTVSLEGTWAYTVAAIDAAGNVGPQSAPISIVYDSTPPPAPFGLSVPQITATQPTLTWTTGGPDTLSGFAYYQVLRDGNPVGTTTQTSYTDAGLTSNGPHVYSVRAVDNAGNTSPASPTQRTIFDSTAPEIPTNVTAPSPTNRPSVTWTASADTGGAGGVVYSVYRDGVRLADRDDRRHELPRHLGADGGTALLHRARERRRRQRQRRVAAGRRHDRHHTARSRRDSDGRVTRRAARDLVGSRRAIPRASLVTTSTGERRWSARP